VYVKLKTRKPQTTTGPGMSGKQQDTPQNKVELAAKLQNNIECVFFVLLTFEK